MSCWEKCQNWTDTPTASHVCCWEAYGLEIIQLPPQGLTLKKVKHQFLIKNVEKITILYELLRSAWCQWSGVFSFVFFTFVCDSSANSSTAHTCSSVFNDLWPTGEDFCKALKLIIGVLLCYRWADVSVACVFFVFFTVAGRGFEANRCRLGLILIGGLESHRPRG